MSESVENVAVAERQAYRARLDGEPEWLHDLRELAWRSWLHTPPPDRIRHLWRYTDPDMFLPSEDADLCGERDESAEVTRGALSERLTSLSATALASPHEVRSELCEHAERAAVILTDLESGLRELGEIVQKRFAAQVGAEFGKFEALNMASWRRGLLLIVPANTVLERPIHLRRLATGPFFPTRLLVIVGENAEVSVIDEYLAADPGPGQVSSVVELAADNSARVKFVSVANLPGSRRLFLTQRNRIARDVDLQSATLAIDAGAAKVNWATELAGKGASSRWAGLLLAGGEQHFDHHTRHRHTAGESFSDLLFKVAVRDEAMSAYTGLIGIEERAANCEAYQENRNLLLSDTARVESIPELEIINDDVKCSHGVTVGPLAEEQLFYLESRGIPRDEGMRIMLAGYFEAVLGTLPKHYQDTGRTMLMKKLTGESRNGHEHLR